MDFSCRKIDVKTKDGTSPQLALNFLNEHADIVETGSSHPQTIDFFDEIADVNLEAECIHQQALNISDETTDINLDAGPNHPQTINIFGKKSDINIEAGPSHLQAMDFAYENADIKLKAGPSHLQAMDFAYENADIKLEAGPSHQQEMDCFYKNADIKLEARPSHQVTDILYEKAYMNVDEPIFHQDRNISLQKADIKTTDKLTQSKSTRSLRQVQRNRKKKQRKEKLGFKPYILRVKKILTPKMVVSSQTLEGLDNLISSVYDMYCSELQRLFSHTKKKTLSSKDVESATKLCFSGKLKENAMNIARNLILCQEELKKNPNCIQEV